jgi:hypothetical protein
MVHKKKNKKTNNGPQEKEQKDKQWSTRKRTKRQTMVHKTLNHRKLKIEQKHELHLKQGVKSGALTIFKILICRLLD